MPFFGQSDAGEKSVFSFARRRLFCYTGGMVSFRSLLVGSAFLFPGECLAQGLPQRSLQVNLGTSLPLSQIIANAISTLAGVIVIFTSVLFLLGAFFMVISRGKEDQLQTGKDLMIKSLIGLAVAGSAYGFIRTLLYVIYTP